MGICSWCWNLHGSFIGFVEESKEATTFGLKTIRRSQSFFQTPLKITGIIFPSTATNCDGINSLSFSRSSESSTFIIRIPCFEFILNLSRPPTRHKRSENPGNFSHDGSNDWLVDLSNSWARRAVSGDGDGDKNCTDDFVGRSTSACCLHIPKFCFACG